MNKKGVNKQNNYVKYSSEIIKVNILLSALSNA